MVRSNDQTMTSQSQMWNAVEMGNFGMTNSDVLLQMDKMPIEEPYFTYAMEHNDWGNSGSSWVWSLE